jgi:hypothetical protein
MNLIQISERLKEAPDNLLMQEVQAPTGQYPSYLIISEMARRKRLRDGGAQQQAPQTTVAEDMASEGGLAATPQAMASTAGMDIQGGEEEEPEVQEMASGGIVAFKRGLDVYGDKGPFDALWDVSMQQGANQRLSQYEQDLTRSRAEEERLSRELTPEQQVAVREAEYGRFGKMVPFRRDEEAARIAQRERALEGERESNVNMSLMEAGLGMMASKAPRGMQGIAEGGLKGLSALRSGKQDIKKSEAYLDQSRDNFARAQELYDAGKYAAGEKALDKAEMQRLRGLEAARAMTQGIYRQREFERGEQMFPGEMKKQELGLSAARQTTPLAGDKAQAEIDLARARAEAERAQAAYYRAGGKGGGGLKPASMGEVNSAYEVAEKRLISEGTNLPANQRPVSGSPAYRALLAEYARNALLAQGKYVDPSVFGSIGGQQPGQQPGGPQRTSSGASVSNW